MGGYIVALTPGEGRAGESRNGHRERGLRSYTGAWRRSSMKRIVLGKTGCEEQTDKRVVLTSKSKSRTSDDLRTELC